MSFLISLIALFAGLFVAILLDRLLADLSRLASGIAERPHGDDPELTTPGASAPIPPRESRHV